MDWKRAKSILIFAFLCLNLLLAYQLWADRFGPAAWNRDSKDMVKDTMELLDSKNIRVMQDIPKETPKLSTINVRFQEGYRTPKEVKLSQPVSFISLLSRSSIREIESKGGIRHLSSYTLDTASTGKDVYLFHQTYEDLPMFDVTLRLFAEDGQITGYKQTYVEVKSGEEPQGRTEQKIISAYAAVRSLAENYLNEGAVITDIRLGYHGQLYDTEDQTFVPNWRISLSDREPYYVHAFTGAVEAIQP